MHIAVGVLIGAGMARHVRAGVVAVNGEAMVAEMVARNSVEGETLATFQ